MAKIGVIQDLIKANRPLIPMAGFTFNEYFQASSALQYKSKGLQCGAAGSLSDNARRSGDAWIAVELMEGKNYAYSIEVPVPGCTRNNGVKTERPTVAMASGT